MSRLSSHRANAPSAKNPSRFKGFRKDWRTDTTVVTSYGDRKRQRRKEAWEKYEAEKRRLHEEQLAKQQEITENV